MYIAFSPQSRCISLFRDPSVTFLQLTDQFPEKWHPALIYISYPRVNCLKTTPFTAAHTHIAHIWQYPPPALGAAPDWSTSWQRPKVRLQNLTLLIASHTQMCMICLELKYFLYLYSFLWWNLKKFANFLCRDLHKWATQVELDVLQAKAVATFIWIQLLVRNNSTFISRHFL